MYTMFFFLESSVDLSNLHLYEPYYIQKLEIYTYFYLQGEGYILVQIIHGGVFF